MSRACSERFWLLCLQISPSMEVTSAVLGPMRRSFDLDLDSIHDAQTLPSVEEGLYPLIYVTNLSDDVYQPAVMYDIGIKNRTVVS